MTSGAGGGFILFLLVLAGMLFGVLLFVLGWKGRRVGDHPHCRRCGFDLFGRPESSSNCPECGSDLASSNIVIGVRKRRRRLLAGGLTMITISAGLAATLGASFASNFNWMTVKPLWWVKLNAQSSVPALHNAALTELYNRLAKNNLSQADTDSIVDLALSWQADQSKPWVTGWGDLVDAAKGNNRLSDDRFTRFLRQTLVIELKVRSQVRKSCDLPISIALGSRVSTKTEPSCHVKIAKLNVSGQEVEIADEAIATALVNLGTVEFTQYIAGDALSKIPPGEHQGAAFLQLEVFSGADVAKYSLEIPFLLHLHADNDTVVRGFEDLRVREQVISSLSNLTIRNQLDNLLVLVDRKSLPVAVSYEVVVRVDGREYPAGYLAENASAFAKLVCIGNARNTPSHLPKAVDVIFRPNPTAAERTVDVFEYWNTEVVIPQVPITGNP